MTDYDEFGLEQLCNAIIVRAAQDYRKASKKANSRGEIKSIERFFRSKWFTLLTSVDGEYILNCLKEEVREV